MMHHADGEVCSHGGAACCHGNKAMDSGCDLHCQREPHKQINAGNVSNDTAYPLSCCCTLLTTSSRVGDTQQTNLEAS